MTDKATRLAQRSGPALVERLRADEIPAYTTVREVLTPRACTCDEPGIRNCFCDRLERAPCDPLDVVRLLAFCGVGEARELPTGSIAEIMSQGWSYADRLGFPIWLNALQRLAAKLPPKRVEARCRACQGSGKPGPVSVLPVALRPTRCAACEGTGHVAHDVPAETWLLVVAALAVAEECAKAAGVHNLAEPDPRCQECQPKLALDACQAWVTEPTPERADWVTPASLPQWLPHPGADHAAVLQAAAEVLGPERVRKLASAAVAGRLLGAGAAGE